MGTNKELKFFFQIFPYKMVNGDQFLKYFGLFLLNLEWRILILKIINSVDHNYSQQVSRINKIQFMTRFSVFFEIAQTGAAKCGHFNSTVVCREGVYYHDYSPYH
jgi:hypothetical protein